MHLLSGDARRAVFAPLDDGALRSEAVVRRVGSAIGLGLLGDGEQLPTEADLATMLTVSTVTLREALAELRKLGLVETRRGRGMFINPGARDLLMEGERQKFLNEQWPRDYATIQRLGLRPEELLKPEPSPDAPGEGG